MPARRHTSLNVLFIGNSFTARNDVPGLISAIAAERGATLRHRLISAGGASLRRHWNKGDAVDAIRAEKYDYVVLQEQSTLPIKNASRMHESVKLFDEAIRAAGSKTALYMTWARAHAPETQQIITDAYTPIAAELGATLVPAGAAWERFLGAHDEPVLHDKDGSHPTLAGSYLAACVIYGVLFEDKLSDIKVAPDGLSDKDAALLRRTAAAALK